ncbi:MAG: YceI family protein [Polyangiaceae bacterium]|nr:YceI family protein [Polyangiaceae bacterium]
MHTTRSLFFAPTTLSTFALAALFALFTTACDDPTKGKAKATTENVTQAATGTATPPQAGVAYKFDGASSQITWVGSKVTDQHKGSFDTFNGTIHLVDNVPEKSSVNVEIDAASLTADATKLTEHLKSNEFFDVAKFTKITFTSTNVKAGGDKGASHTVTGNLSLHGVTKALTFPATIAVSGDQISVNAEFALNRKDFGITYPGKPDDLIRDEALVKLAIVAKK